MTEIINREQWLTVASEILRAEIMVGYKVPKYRVSCSFPNKRATSTVKRCIGQCWHDANKSGTIEVLISPVLDEPVDVLATLLHELLHAALPKGTGHKAPFARACKAVGLEGKPTSTEAGEDLAYTLKAIADRIGEYPHDSLSNIAVGKQPTRLLKVWCPVCHYVIRVTAKWIDSDGCPICPSCQISMQEAEGDGDENPLAVAESHTEYALKGDHRFTVRMSRRGREVSWCVIDYGDALLDPAPARLTPAESRQDALDLIDSLREGLLTYAALDAEDDIDVPDDFDPDDAETWTPSPEELAQDAADLAFLADDEEEAPDYDPDRDLLGQLIEVGDFEAEAQKRDAAGAVKSDQIGRQAA